MPHDSKFPSFLKNEAIARQLAKIRPISMLYFEVNAVRENFLVLEVCEV